MDEEQSDILVCMHRAEVSNGNFEEIVDLDDVIF